MPSPIIIYLVPAAHRGEHSQRLPNNIVSLAPVSSSATNTTPVPPGAPPYKMEPGDPAAGAGAGVYYPAPAPDTAAAFQPGHGAGAELVATDFMQTLQTYMGQPVDMQHHEGGWIVSWIDIISSSNCLI